MTQNNMNETTLRQNGRNLGLLMLRVVFGLLMILGHDGPNLLDGRSGRSHSLIPLAWAQPRVSR